MDFHNSSSSVSEVLLIPGTIVVISLLCWLVCDAYIPKCSSAILVYTNFCNCCNCCETTSTTNASEYDNVNYDLL